MCDQEPHKVQEGEWSAETTAQRYPKTVDRRPFGCQRRVGLEEGR